MEYLRQHYAVVLLLILAIGRSHAGPLDEALKTVRSWFFKETAIPLAKEMAEENTPTARAHFQILREMFAVVLEREPRDKRMLEGYVVSLSQGASLEGVYNGLTHSSLYRDIETAAPVADPQAREVFFRELKALRSQMKSPTVFDLQSALPLERPVDPGNFEEPQRAIVFNKKHQVPSMEKLFAHSSRFTLKRVLGDEALRLISELSTDRKILADWYSNQVVRWSGLGVDFGMGLRNKSDAQFHKDWALKVSQDQLIWEVLNRLHRLMAEKPKSLKAGSAISS